MGGVIGIDLGTTNTAVAVDGKVRVLDLGGSKTLPSVVAFLPNGRVDVGRAAEPRRSIDAENTIFSAKRVMGLKWSSSGVQEFCRRYPFKFEEDPAGYLRFVTRGGKLTPMDIAATVLSKASEGSGIDFEGGTGIIAVPSTFRESQVLATVEAGRRAGLAQVEVIREPTATAVAYLRAMQPGVRRAAVYDLGGGTFDFAVLDCTSDPFNVLAHSGDPFLGGDDVDFGLASWVAEEVLRTHGWDLRDDAAVFGRLRIACEKAKIELATEEKASIDIKQVDSAAPVDDPNFVIGRDRLAQLAMDLVKRTFIVCDETLMRADIKARDLDAVFLAGGATSMHVIRQGVAAYFQQEPLTNLEPMHVVALGASMKGAYDLAQRMLRR